MTLEINQKVFDITFKLWLEVKKFQQPADVLLSKLFKENRKINKSDKNIIAETIYTILRNYIKLSKVTDNDGLLIMLAWYRLMDVSAQKLRSVSVKLFDQVEKLPQLDNTVIELPEWIIEELSQSMSMNEIKELDESMSSQPELTIRVNTVKTSRKELIALLNEQGFKAIETKYSPYGITLSSKSALMNNNLFKDGYFEVQDEASQLAGMLFDAKKSEMIADFCAGSGGKTLLFGMTMRNSGRIYAFDNNERRLSNLKPRLARSGLSNIYSQLINNENDSKLKKLAEKMDRVFVDAPCLGLGTIRRNPDLKFRQNTLTLAEITKLQLSILNSASKLVKLGGVLAYATCSILAEENQNIINNFLQEHSEFTIINLKQSLEKLGLQVKNDNFLELYPHVHNTDGFFCCLMQKK